MKQITSTLSTTATFSDDGTKRFCLEKLWDSQKPNLAIIMLAPSTASSVSLDATTQFCLNNADRLNYGSLTILNLFATLNDFGLKQAEAEDPENLDAIIKAAERATTVVYAAGTGKIKNKLFLARQAQVISALAPFADKLHCLCAADGSCRLQHPLSPSVREWHLSKLDPNELIPDLAEPQTAEQKKKGKPKPAKKE